jgi:hypothetical protein
MSCLPTLFLTEDHVLTFPSHHACLLQYLASRSEGQASQLPLSPGERTGALGDHTVMNNGCLDLSLTSFSR